MKTKSYKIDSIVYLDGFFNIEGQPILEHLIKKYKAVCEPRSFRDKNAFAGFVEDRLVAFTMTFDLNPNAARATDDLAELYGVMCREIETYLRSISGDGIVALVEDRITRSYLGNSERKEVRLLYLADVTSHAETIEFESMREMVNLGAHIGSYEVGGFKGSLIDVEGPYNLQLLWNRAEPLMRNAGIKHCLTMQRAVS